MKRRALVVIKAVSKERIGKALLEFDKNYRDKPGWQGWEDNLAHRYAVASGGLLYPAKKIVSLATGVGVTEFSGGRPTNSYLEKRGFVIVELPRGQGKQILKFTQGAVYDRKTEINGPFGGSQQSGIAPSALYPAIFLFTGDSGEQYGYADDWEDGAFLYTGEGQRGPMTLTRGNRAIAEHAENGRALYVFKALGKGEGNTYLGEFSCVDFFIRSQLDVDGQERTALVFRLVPVGTSEDIHLGEEEEISVELSGSLAEARLAALAACKPDLVGSSRSALREIYQRSRSVAHYVLMRAQGQCESCEMPAPFTKKDGTPYPPVPCRSPHLPLSSPRPTSSRQEC